MTQFSKKYKAVMFDVDGTLTNMGERFIPGFLEAKLRELIDRGIPLAICSGRHHPDSIVNRLENVSPEKWTLIAENGAVGYTFEKGWQEFYRVPWPEHIISKDELAKILHSQMKFSKFFNNPSSLIFRPDMPLENVDLRIMAQKCDEYEEKMKKIFEERGISGLRVNNSHIGIILNPVDGDKDRGVQEFAKLLGIEDTKEIVCIGDQPEPGCNDFYFLNGEYGTPFVVNGPLDTFGILTKGVNFG